MSANESTDPLDHLSRAIKRHVSTVNAPTVKADRVPQRGDLPVHVVLGDYGYAIDGVIKEVQRQKTELMDLKAQAKQDHRDLTYMQWWVGFAVLLVAIMVGVGSMVSALMVWGKLAVLV